MKKRKFGGSAGGSKYRVDLEIAKPLPKFIQKLRQQADQQDITLENKLRQKPEIQENDNENYDIENAQILEQDEENKFQETEAFIKQKQHQTETEEKFDKEQFHPTFHKKTNLFIQKQDKMNRKLNFKVQNLEKELSKNENEKQQEDNIDKDDKEIEKQQLIGQLMKKGNLKIQKQSIINNKLEDQIKKKVKNNLLSFADIED